MMRSLFSGVAGLRTHQTRMDVIGNNIANVNTVAYKSQTATFQELMYQNTQNASAANNETGRGGINMKQIGLGSSLGAINTNIALSGSSQSTGNALDIQIAGDAFFVVSDGSQNFFTRAGAFYIDGAGNLAMTSNGYTVMGWLPNEQGTGVIVDNVKKLQVMSPDNLTAAPEQTTKAYIEGVIDKNDTHVNDATGRLVNVSIYDSLGYSYIAQYSFKTALDATNQPIPGAYDCTPVKLLDSKGKTLYSATEDPTDEDVADGRATAGTPNTWKVTLSGMDDAGNPIAAKTPYRVTFDTKTGKITAPETKADTGESRLGLVVTGIDAFQPLGSTTGTGYNCTVSIDLANLNMYDNKGTSTPEGHYGDKKGEYAGRRMGTLSGIAVQQDGIIVGSYDNGTTRILGQIAVTSFANPSGLEKVGDNLYQTTPNSGNFDGIGKDITADGSGKMKSGVLEMSNVDLSQEFTEMITTQRGFQANSRIITVSDTMLEELINLKR